MRKKTKWTFLLRAFIPSWEFFIQPGAEYKLLMRHGDSKENLSDWQICLPQIKRSLANLLLNPKGNYLHACHTNIQQLVDDLTHIDGVDEDSVTQLVPYRITKNLVEDEVCRKVGKQSFFQFQILAVHPSYMQTPEEVLLISPIYLGDS